MDTITVKEYLTNRNAFYLADVRTPSEFVEAHIKDANLHPLDDINAGELRFKSQEKQILFTCLSGARAAKAAQKLESEGLKIALLEGSLQAWEAAGEPVVRNTPSGLPLIRQVHLTVSIINITAALLAIFVNPAWAWVLVGTGAGLFLAGATGFCGMGLLLAKMPWNKKPLQTDSCEAG
ncbi:rhodanese-like domain-containing protein [Rubritalea spongiae]|uniref:Rhodanese-like domain-containing protein n=1 Tax=Rubritalea spongiae TaxID=430797 RepID=A0ABW5E4M0_9BACT